VYSDTHKQSVVGILLAACIFAVWLCVHLWAMFVLTIHAGNLWIVPFIFALQCWLSVGMFIVAHDGMHGSLSPAAPRIGTWIGGILLFLYAGFGWHKMRGAHMEHHAHVGTAHDPDYNADNPHDFWPWYMLFLKRYFGWMSMAWVWSVVLTYYFVLDVPPQNIALLYGFPAIASSLQLFYFGTYRPHRHEHTNVSSGAFTDRHNARTNDYGPIRSLFTCFHFGYHHEHHLSPGVPWWGLPARHKLYVKERQYVQERST
jgi:beta-carotene/zeaxanthin 4-ketolase